MTPQQARHLINWHAWLKMCELKEEAARLVEMMHELDERTTRARICARARLSRRERKADSLSRKLW